MMKLVLTGVLAFCIVHGHAQQKQNMKKASCVEVVTFRPIESVSNASLKEAMEATNTIVQNMDGFIARTTSIDENGEFIDVVYWENKWKALKAAQNIMQIPEVAKNFALIDPKSIAVKHYEIFARQ